MNVRHALKKILLLAFCAAVLFAVASQLPKRTPLPASFAECAAAGNPIAESYPRGCRTADGTIFKEDIGNELQKDNLIRIASPRPNDVVGSPLAIHGAARGSWFFEASFPVRLLDDTGTEIAHGFASTSAEWMTSEFIPFDAEIIFDKPAGERGTLILEKENPSGLPEHADALIIPVRFR